MQPMKFLTGSVSSRFTRPSHPEGRHVFLQHAVASGRARVAAALAPRLHLRLHLEAKRRETPPTHQCSPRNFPRSILGYVRRDSGVLTTVLLFDLENHCVSLVCRVAEYPVTDLLFAATATVGKNRKTNYKMWSA